MPDTRDTDRLKARADVKGVIPKQPIPRLDAEPIVGEDGEPLSMAEQAQQGLQDRGDARHPDYDPSIPPAPPHRTRAPFAPTPQSAAEQPGYRPGVGAGFAVNQPDLQPPQDPAAGRLRPETVKGLDALGKFQQRAEEEQQTQGQAEQRSEDGAVAAMLQQLGLDDPAFLEELRQENKGSQLERPEVRKAIEGRCPALDLDQLITDGEIHQDVPIVREKLVPTFRTYSGSEELDLHRMMGEETIPNKNYAQARFALLRLVCGLHSLNGNPLPDHRGPNKRIDDKNFAAKLEMVGNYSLQLLNTLSVNYGWFSTRAEELFVDVEEIKNG